MMPCLPGAPLVRLLLLLLAYLLASASGGVATDPLIEARLGIVGAGAEQYAFFAGGYANGFAPSSDQSTR